MFESTEEIPSPAPWARVDSLSLFFCAIIGFILAIAPHLATWARHGTLEFLTDTNDVAYINVARSPYYGGPLKDPYTRPEWGTSPASGAAASADPFLKPGAAIPSPYAWLQFVPLARLTRLLGLPLILIGLVWRAVGGPLLGTAVFVLFRALFSGTRAPTAWALGASLICLSDAGFIRDQPLILNPLYLRNAWLGKRWLLSYCRLEQYRVVTPLLNLPFLMLLAAVLVPFRRDGRPAVLKGSLLLGLCILLYFFTWTTAVAGLGLYLGVLSVCAWKGWGERSRMTVRAWTAAAVLAGGAILGAPQVISNARTSRVFSSTPSLQSVLPRWGAGARVPSGHPARRRYLKNYWLWAKLLLGAAAILRFRSAGLALVWCLTAAAYLLGNSALVTGVEFQNDHWLLTAGLAFGEILVLASAVFFLDRRPGSAGAKILWALPASLLLCAFFWRPYQALESLWAAKLSRTLDELRPLKPSLASLSGDCTLAGAPEVMVAVLYNRCAPLYQHADMHSSLITTEQINERQALNGWLSGLDEASYARLSETERSDTYFRFLLENPRLFPPGENWEAYEPKRLALFRRLLKGQAPELLEKYRPNTLLIPSSAAVPVRGGPWALIQRTDLWSLWKKTSP